MYKLLSGISVCSLALLSFTAHSAENYTTFLSAEYSSLKTDATTPFGNFESDDDYWQLSASHFFAPRPVMGPLKEFQFINQQSYIAASAAFSDQADSQGLSGEYIWNDWVVSASTTFGDADSASVGVGYFITQDFKVSIYNNSYNDAGGLFDSDESDFSFGVDYVYPLAGKDYIGASFNTNEDFDFSTLITKYFTALGDDRYLSLSASAVVYGDDFGDIEDTVSLRAEYYISQYTSFSVMLRAKGETDGFNVGASHYFDENSSLSLTYSDTETNASSGAQDVEYDRKMWNLSYQYQF